MGTAPIIGLAATLVLARAGAVGVFAAKVIGRVFIMGGALLFLWVTRDWWKDRNLLVLRPKSNFMVRLLESN